MEDKVVYIYGLTDTSGNIRYVGQSVTPWLRYEQHLVDEADTPKVKWIRSMLTKGKKPGLIILDKTNKENARFVEKWWIVLGKQKKWQLTNSSDPTWKSPNFGDMFAQYLKHDFNEFIAEHDPVFMVTQRHKAQIIFWFRVTLGIVIGAIMAWNVYLLEASIAPHPLIAVFYAFSVFVFAGYTGFFWAIDEFKQLGGAKLMIMCASPLVLVIINTFAWIMG